MPSNDTEFRVTDAQLRDQLVNGWIPQGEHKVWPDSSLWILSEDGPRAPRQVVARLLTGDFDAVIRTTCGEPACLRLDHNAIDSPVPLSSEDEQFVDLVQRTTVSLADLYRRGKARGLLSSRTQYH